MGWRHRLSATGESRRGLSNFWHDRTGVGAVEFALIAPLLLMIYITVFELTIGLSVSKRVARASGTIADLVTQQKSVTPHFLGTMVDVAEGIFVPYGGADFDLKITGITVDSTNPKVLWSWDDAGNKPYTAGETIAIPTQMKVPGSFVVHAELSVPHRLLMFMPGLLPSQVRDITISRDYYFRARSGAEIKCLDC